MRKLYNTRGYEITTIKIGGNIPNIIIAETTEDLIKLLKEDSSSKVIGRGSNLIFKDEDCSIPIILNRSNEIKWNLEYGEVTADSGVDLSHLVQIVNNLEYGGLEFLHDIPGTVGGAVYMNAGAWGKSLSNVFARAEVLNGLRLETWTSEQFHFGYRQSVLQSNPYHTLLTATFKIKPMSKTESFRLLSDYYSMRAQSQPLLKDIPSAGTIFVSHLGEISKLPIKGLQVGRARFSEINPLFIENLGGATCSNVLQLIDKVSEMLGKTPKLEVEII